MTTIILIIIVVVVIIAKFVMSRHFEEWREVDIDNVERMRNCDCYRCKHMIALYEEYQHLCYP